VSVAKPRSDAQLVIQRAKEAEVLRRRIVGQPYRQIAAEVGYESVSGAFDAFKRAMAATIDPVREAAEEYRTLMQERLEGDLAALAEKRALGDAEAIRVGLAVEKSLRELKGLDAPTQITGDMTVNYRLVTDGQVDITEALT